jgi:hypothetical protein
MVAFLSLTRFLAGSTLGGAVGGALLSFLEAIAVTGQGEDLRAMHETVNEGDDAGGVGEDLVPFAEGFV